MTTHVFSYKESKKDKFPALVMRIQLLTPCRREMPSQQKQKPVIQWQQWHYVSGSLGSATQVKVIYMATQRWNKKMPVPLHQYENTVTCLYMNGLTFEPLAASMPGTYVTFSSLHHILKNLQLKSKLDDFLFYKIT